MTSLRGVKLVARQEFRVRLRSGRWRWLLGSWFVVVGLFTLLLDLGLSATQTYYSTSLEGFQSFPNPKGPQMLGILMLFVLALTLVISPTLTAQSINGDRERGTLATLQVTLLTPAEIAIGKLLSGWLIGLVALGLTIPYVGFSVYEGGVGVVRAVVTLLVVGFLIGLVCAISQALSALLSRSITSALLSYVTVFALTAGTVIAFGLSTMMTQTEVTHKPTGNGDYGYTSTESHPEYTWWLLAPNPFVILADSAPGLPPFVDPETHHVIERQADILGSIRDSVRRTTMSRDEQDAYFRSATFQENGFRNGGDISPVWPYGMAFDVLLGAGAVWVTIRRLRSPAEHLPKGVRIA